MEILIAIVAGETLWIVGQLLLIIHLVDYQRSVAAAAAAFMLLTAGSLYFMYLHDGWVWLPAVAPFLLWSLNGVRAVHADRTMG